MDSGFSLARTDPVTERAEVKGEDGEMKKRFLPILILVFVLGLACRADADTGKYFPYRTFSEKSYGQQQTAFKMSVGEKVNLYLDYYRGTVRQWKSSNSKVAAVDKNGVVKGVKAGKAVITAITNVNTQYTFNVTVKAMILDRTSVEMPVGAQRTITAKQMPVEASWKSSNRKVATVTKKGVIKAVSSGNATISASIGGRKYKVKVKVKKKLWDGSKIDKHYYYIAPGEKLQLTSYGKKFKANWESSDKNVVIVTKNGVIKGVKSGYAGVEAIVNGFVCSCGVYVEKPEPYLYMPFFYDDSSMANLFDYDSDTNTYSTSMGPEPHDIIILYNKNARAANYDDRLMEVTKWTSSDPEVVSVKKKNNITATLTSKKSGSATITATCRGKKYQFKVEIENKESDTKNLVQEIYEAAGIEASMKPQYQLFLLAKWESEHFTYGFVGEPNENGAYYTTNPAFKYLEAYKYRTAVCQAYSDLFHYCAIGLGIEAVQEIHLAENMSDNHIWNKVKIDGQWYNIDVTWMDNDPGYLMKFFLSSVPTYPTDNTYPTTSTRFEKCTWEDWNNGNWVNY